MAEYQFDLYITLQGPPYHAGSWRPEDPEDYGYMLHEIGQFWGHQAAAIGCEGEWGFRVERTKIEEANGG